MIAKPPSKLVTSPFQHIAENEPTKLDDYLNLFSPIDSRGRYLHFDEFKYKLPQGLDTTVAWSVVKMARARQLQTMFEYH